MESIAFGDALQRSRIACLTEIDPPRKALLVGEGNGRFLAALLTRYPDVAVDCIDASSRMLQIASRRLERASKYDAKVQFIHEDVRSSIGLTTRYDLIVTHFFLDCFPERTARTLVKKLGSVATHHATWLLADFRLPNNKISRFRARIWLKAMYLFFRFTTRIEADDLVDPEPFLVAEQFNLIRQHLFRGGLLKSELWQRM